MREQLGALHEQAATGVLDGLRASPQGCLALVILLDQVPRNIFRDQPRAYASDAKAREIVRHAMAQGFDRQLSQTQRVFLYLPMEHSESLADQDQCLALMGALDENPKWLEYSQQHRDIIARFGRFPHRNAMLDRPSTAEEKAFLEQPGSSF